MIITYARGSARALHGYLQQSRDRPKAAGIGPGNRPGLGTDKEVNCKDLGLASCVLGSSAPRVRWAG